MAALFAVLFIYLVLWEDNAWLTFKERAQLENNRGTFSSSFSPIPRIFLQDAVTRLNAVLEVGKQNEIVFLEKQQHAMLRTYLDYVTHFHSVLRDKL